MHNTISFRQLPTVFRLLLATCLLILFCYSRTYGQQRWSAGPRVGVNLSDMTGDVQNRKMLPGLMAGVGVMYSDISRFGVAIDVLFSQRGAKFDVPFQNGRIAFNQRLNYLEVPITLRYYLNDGGNFRPNVYFGPSVAYMLKAKRTNQKLNNNDIASVDNSPDFRPLDLGITGGIQFNFRAGDRQRFLIDARYTYGISDISVASERIQNSTITVGLGYSWGIGREYTRRDPKLRKRD